MNKLRKTNKERKLAGWSVLVMSALPEKKKIHSLSLNSLILKYIINILMILL